EVAVTFKEVWAVDFEFAAAPGERPRPFCMVAWELRSGRVIRLWGEELRNRRTAPFNVGIDSLVVAYYASAEMGCFIALGWPMPIHLLDLFTEFRCLTNGKAVPCGNGLLGAMAYHGLPVGNAAEKKELQLLAARGGPWTAEERAELSKYCSNDTQALMSLYQ